MTLTLYHLRTSPFAEKARWGLDYKGLAWEKKLLVPGSHAKAVEKVSGTRTVPMLVDSEASAPITDSTDILQHLETIAPQPPLFPRDAEERRRVLEIEDWLDEEVARPCARLLYTYLTEHPAAFAVYFTSGLSTVQRFHLQLVRPLLPRILARFRAERELNREAAGGYRNGVVDAFNHIEGMLDNSNGGYLVGDAFSAADLTAGCMLALALRLEGSPWEPSPAELKGYPDGTEPVELLEVREELAERPAAAWAAELWRRHRRQV